VTVNRTAIGHRPNGNARELSHIYAFRDDPEMRAPFLTSLVGLMLAGDLRAEPAKHPAEESADARWSEGTAAGRAVEKGGPLVIWVVVPLCDNDQIDCGSDAAGSPRDLKRNLYWGAVFGHKRFFERDNSIWEKLSDETDGFGDSGELERVSYRRMTGGSPWGRKDDIEEIVVLSAYAGDRINDAVMTFWKAASSGAMVTIHTPDPRKLQVGVVGYAGHDRLMDGVELPSEPKTTSADAIPSFVFACYSKKYFKPSLDRVGSETLAMTKALMAPEGYTVDAMARALGDNRPRSAVVRQVVESYAKWQRIGVNVAAPMFE
jgi:hypothetical protein